MLSNLSGNSLFPMLCNVLQTNILQRVWFSHVALNFMHIYGVWSFIFLFCHVVLNRRVFWIWWSKSLLETVQVQAINAPQIFLLFVQMRWSYLVFLVTQLTVWLMEVAHQQIRLPQRNLWYVTARLSGFVDLAFLLTHLHVTSIFFLAFKPF